MTRFVVLITHAVFVAPFAGAQRASATIGRSLDSLVAPAFAQWASGGAVLVAKDGQVLLRRAYGFADVELQVSMRPDHVFRIGSITKQFTGVAILQLVAAGRLALNDDVRRHVPDFDTHGKRITVEQVLTHTSGLPNLVDLEGFDSLARHDHSVAALLALTKDVPLHFEPGTAFRYSDTGYILLGAIIERVSGLSYADYVESRIAKPLGMTRTYYADDARVLPGRARGYTIRDSVLVNASYISMSVPHAAGALGSTVDDLYRWHVALREGRVVPRELLERAWEGRMLPGGVHSGYGFGFKSCQVGGRRSVSHGGFVNGFLAQALQIRDDGIDVIVLANNDSDAPDAGQLARRIARFLVTGAAQPTLHALTAHERRMLSGHYQLGPNDVRQIFDSAGQMYSRRNKRPPLPLVALSPTQLTLAPSEGDYLLTFTLGADGRAVRMATTLGCEPVDAGTRVDEAGLRG